ncbi:hypothetical protein B0H19DRAFT_1066670 [Mycena capillaripes]|nr:hypothetical protein B0H19DRAFT_1066670 [Mycena capillaripes]
MELWIWTEYPFLSYDSTLALGIPRNYANQSTDGEDMAVAASGSNQAARILGHTNYVIYPFFLLAKFPDTLKYSSTKKRSSDTVTARVTFSSASYKEMGEGAYQTQVYILQPGSGSGSGCSNQRWVLPQQRASLSEINRISFILVRKRVLLTARHGEGEGDKGSALHDDKDENGDNLAQ